MNKKVTSEEAGGQLGPESTARLLRELVGPCWPSPLKGGPRASKGQRPGLGLPIAFDVEGDPAPEPRPRFDLRSGRTYVPKTADAWKLRVRAAARARIRGLQGGGVEPAAAGLPISVDLEFRLPRPRSHFGTGRNAGRLRAAAPEEHVRAPDVDNLAKAVLDALGPWKDRGRRGVLERLGAWDGRGTPIAWRTDAQVVAVSARKRWAGEGEAPGAWVRVRRHWSARALREWAERWKADLASAPSSFFESATYAPIAGIRELRGPIGPVYRVES